MSDILTKAERAEMAAKYKWACNEGDEMDVADTAHYFPRLLSHIEALENACAEAYQMAGALDAPVRCLDNLSAASRGAPLPHKTMLPVGPSTRTEALTAVLGLVQAWWDDVYPAAIFTGVSGDEGSLRVAEIRAALQRLQERE